MPWIDTASLSSPDAVDALGTHDAHQVYNGLDATCTFEIHEVLSEELRTLNEPGPRLIYDFKRAMQAPALAMMERGIRVDIPLRAQKLDELMAKREWLEARLNKLSIAISGQPCNPRSGDQCKALFYNAMGIEPIVVRKKGESKEPMDLEILEKIRDGYPWARPAAQHIIAVREMGKSIGYLRTPTPDGRLHCSYNVAATETDRWSSSEGVFGYGTNLQNVTPELRDICIADPGYKFIHSDLSQVQSYIVGMCIFRACGNDAYLQACETRDLHTAVARMVWPDLPWTGDIKKDRVIADRPFYRKDSYRQSSKKLGHATNFLGRAWELSRRLRIPQALIEDFQEKYLDIFSVSEYHLDVAKKIQLTQTLTTMIGSRRQFFGRSWDDATLREALAHEPQNVEAFILNNGLYRIYRGSPWIQLLLQEHDAFTAQFPEGRDQEAVEAVTKALTVTLQVEHEGITRTTVVPCDAKVGWNWGEFDEERPDKNPDGLRKWTGRDDRVRQGNPRATLLDKQIRSSYRGPANS